MWSRKTKVTILRQDREKKSRKRNTNYGHISRAIYQSLHPGIKQNREYRVILEVNSREINGKFGKIFVSTKD